MYMIKSLKTGKTYLRGHKNDAGRVIMIDWCMADEGGYLFGSIEEAQAFADEWAITEYEIVQEK